MNFFNLKTHLAVLLVASSFFGSFSGYAFFEEKEKTKSKKEAAETVVKTRQFQGFDFPNDDPFYYDNYSNSPEFDNDYISQHFQVDSVTQKDRLIAKAVFDDLDRSGNYVDYISGEDLISFPVGTKQEIGNITYMMGISKAVQTPEHTLLTVFVKIVIPQKDEKQEQLELFFGADNVKLSYEGGLFGAADLILLGDIPIPINGGNGLIVLKGSFDMQTGSTFSQTYVTVECDGFKEMGIQAEVLFPRKMITPVDANYQPIADPNALVKGSFQTIASDWNDILVDLTLPAFQLTKQNATDSSGKGGIVFEINTATLDFSDLRNSPNFDFPEGYQEFLVSGNEQLWRGVYVNSLQIVLPEQFKKRSSEERIRFEANQLLIDGYGVSGIFSVNDVLSIDEGEASHWQFSVDRFEVAIITNSIVGASFDGKIVLPVSEEVSESNMDNNSSPSALPYSALINPETEEYQLTIATTESLDFNIFQAKATLAPNSYVELVVSEKRFKPRAVLFGEMDIAVTKNNDVSEKVFVAFKGISFHNLQLQTERPYFQVDYMGYEGNFEFANFPASISEIGITSTNDIAALHFDLAINLMGENGGFAGETSLSIFGKMNQRNGLNRWQYDRVETDQINIIADLGKIKMEGYVEIKDDDPVYGNGFYGELEADFNNITVSASAWFGKTDFRYWYVDAFADLSETNIKMKIGPANVNGFGGGAYYRMTKNPTASMPIYEGKAIKIGPPTPSGQEYKPDGDAGLGFRALLGFALENESAFNGQVGFEMAFNRSGGLNRVFFFGEGHIMKSMNFEFGDKFKNKLSQLEKGIAAVEDNKTIQDLKNTNLVNYSKEAFPQDGLTFDVGIDAHFSMEMDFRNKVFHAQMEVYLNTPGNFFSGVGDRGRAGWAVFHAAPSEWYLHVGTPEDRIGLRFGINAFSLKTRSYFMIGDYIPGSPPPPPEVAETLNIKDLNTLDYMRDLNALGTGSGFAFGMDFSVDTGDITFLIFYARFKAGLGFDIMIKDYGETSCKGRGTLGIDGWYANGQAYAYLQGELGVDIKLFMVRKKVPIIKTGAALLLQAKLPNPAWFRGYLGGYYNLLGGLVKGRYRFKIELGEECEVVGGAPLGGLKIISDITPNERADDVDVFVSPQVAFNMQIDKPFQFEDDEGVKTYRIRLEELRLTDQKGTSISGQLEWNENNDGVNFVSNETLPANAQMKLSVKVSFQQRDKGRWITIEHEGKPALEAEERSFTTGEAPDYIPLWNVVYSYPVVGQEYFYKDEYNQGYIQLHQGQSYLFQPESEWQQRVIFESQGQVQSFSEVNYSSSLKRVRFNFPSTLQNNKQHTLKIVSIPISEGGRGVKETYTSIETGQEGNTIEVRNNKAQEVLSESSEVELINYEFNISRYNTFAEKIKAKKQVQILIDLVSSDVQTLLAKTISSEPFGIEELKGVRYTDNKCLVSVEATLEDDYYRNYIYPLIYEDYPLLPDLTVDRDIDELGLPPKRGIGISSRYLAYSESNKNHSQLRTLFPFKYDIVQYYFEDFKTIQLKTAEKLIKDALILNDRYEKLITYGFIPLQIGNYQITLQYVLPDGTKGSTTNFSFKKEF